MSKKILLIIGIALAILLVVILLYAFVLKKPEIETGGLTGNKTTLIYWGLWEPESVMQPIIDAYEEANPSIKIEYVQRSFTQYDEITYTRIMQGTLEGKPAPDIIKIHNTWLPRYQQFLYPLPQTVMTSAEYSSIFFPVVKDSFSDSTGTIYAMPMGIDGLALFYNKRLLREAGYDTPPTDWNSFVEASKKLTKYAEDGSITQSGVAMGCSDNVKHAADTLNLLFLQNNVNPFPNENGQASLSGAKAITALEFYTDFVTVHKTWMCDTAWDLDLFYSEKVAMMFAPSWRAFDIMQAASQVEFGIAEVPQLPNNPEVNYGLFWAEAVSKKSKYPEESWKFIKYLSEQETLKDIYTNSSKVRAFGQPYPRIDVASEQKSNPYIAAIISEASSMKTLKMGNQTVVHNALNKAIENVAKDISSPSSALQQAQQEINASITSTTE